MKSSGPYLFVGVDPGFTGALCFLEDVEGEEVIAVHDMPLRAGGGRSRLDRDATVELIRTAADSRKIVAAVEAVGTMGGKMGKDGSRRREGAVSMFRFGQGQGELLGILSGLGAFIFEIPASVWKMKAGLIHVPEKEVCKRALKLFSLPRSTLFGPRGGPLHGRAEALYLAAYCRMIVEGRQIHDR